MTRSRTPKLAPTELLSLSKATLADLAWEFVGLASENADDHPHLAGRLIECARELGAPRGDLRVLGVLHARLWAQKRTS